MTKSKFFAFALLLASSSFAGVLTTTPASAAGNDACRKQVYARTLSEAITYTNGLPKTSWFNPKAKSAEQNAKQWMGGPAGQRTLNSYLARC